MDVCFLSDAREGDEEVVMQEDKVCSFAWIQISTQSEEEKRCDAPSGQK